MALSGATFIGTRQVTGQKQTNIGHFFLALDPAAFREPGAFEAEMDEMIACLRNLKPTDQTQPVLVPADPELMAKQERTQHGIPIRDKLWGSGARYLRRMRRAVPVERVRQA